MDRVSAVKPRTCRKHAATYLTEMNGQSAGLFPTMAREGSMNSNGVIRAEDHHAAGPPNGHWVLLVRENHATASVSLRGLIKAGAMYDGDDKAGVGGFPLPMRWSAGRRIIPIRRSTRPMDSLGATFGVGASDESAGFYGRCLSGRCGCSLRHCQQHAVAAPTFPRHDSREVCGVRF